MKILVLGCKGQLGRCLNDQLVNTDHEVIYTSREQIDIANFEVTKSKILEFSPDLIINATAYTAVDKAEEEKKIANLINHLAVKNIADICNQLKCWLIHVSTDYVFDGNSKVPYKEDDQTNPQGAYGETKLKGELAIQASGCKYIIIRTAWVFSEYGNNFLKTMLRLGAERDELSIVGDQMGCPTYAQDIARSIVAIATKLNSQKDYGIYHYCGDQPCSWFDFAKEIFDQLKMYDQISTPTIKAVTTEEYPTLAKRPKFSVLDNKKIQENFDIFSSDWKVGVESSLKRLVKDSCI
ncbi:dTDP-4-dehydrorhamnose reductase [Porticoccaceae bacterium]|nr:dTDP-4-dehydrorhamnose reductase [Porticoccaceae bacterium]